VEEFFCQDFSGAPFGGERPGSLNAYGQLANDGDSLHVDGVQLNLLNANGQVVATEALQISMDVPRGRKYFDLTYEDPPPLGDGMCTVTFFANDAALTTAQSPVASPFEFGPGG
jgi:hypothetical protein